METQTPASIAAHTPVPPYCPVCGTLLTHDTWHAIGGVVICTACLDALQPRLLETLRRLRDNPHHPCMTRTHGLRWYTPITHAAPPRFLTPTSARTLLDCWGPRSAIDA